MTIKPILFSGPMVRALLGGRKSQTRRVLKPQPACTAVQFADDDDGRKWWPDPIDSFADETPLAIPYAPGGLLWVRETWAVHGGWGSDPDCWREAHLSGRDVLLYHADDLPKPEQHHFRPSIHMPRWASRLTLEVTDVRVQRVQEISKEDVWSEGISPPVEFMSPEKAAALCQKYGDDHAGVAVFAELWDHLNAKRDFGWEVNPWVAVLTFTVHRCNVDQMEKAA